MSMLELITKASPTPDSQYPILLNPDPILLNLNPQIQDPNNQSFITPLQEPFAISQTDTDIIQLSQSFFKKLKTKLKNPNSFTKNDFITMLNTYLEKNSEIVGTIVDLDRTDEGYTKRMVEKFGFLMGEAVLGLVIDGCVGFEIWDVLESLVVGGLVDGSGCGDLVGKLVERNRSDLVCLCVEYVANVGVNDVLLVLKYFLSPGKDACGGMSVVREEWERQAVLAIEMARDLSLSEEKLRLAKDAAVLLIMGYDEFKSNELCLHYLLASANFDDVMFSACVRELNGMEIMGLVRYLKKWLVKYQKFSQACSSTKGSSSLKASESVPSLEHVTKCFGLVVDEHFSSLVMHPEFREEVKSVELIVSSLAAEARICFNLANLCAGLQN